MDKISVIVPIYNVEDYVAQCIESICAQTYTNLEIILVNDGSTDNCLTIMEKYAAKDDRVVVINQKNQGANAARNSGLLQATGEWVCFVDGDDWIDTIMCEELSKYFSQDWDVIFYSYRKVYPSGISEKKYSDGCFEITKEDFRELQLATLNRLGPYRFGVNTMETVSIVDKIYRREFLIKNNLFLNEKLPKLQDLFFNLQIYDYANRGFVVNK
ncbi:MAG: glycosyltransferase, partial [Lachnospiraceae bacterium]|nr:glycosyltransferase [Lachnospiraceae bacterium]